ncbi:MAG: hypothetical protein GY847_04035 [Proteobacteria bacterium]|nr:hypothetical protein [Pseudomonadota bacterium]
MCRFYIWFMLVSTVLGCSSSPDETEKKNTGVLPTTPIVTDGRTDLILSWFADGGSQVASSVSLVPKDSRKEVRVQDPAIPPENRDPRWIFLADLTQPDSSGKYSVRAVFRAEYEKKRQEAYALANPPDPPPTAAAGSAPPVLPSPSRVAGAMVVMYSTRHCPVCVKARRWLLDQKIPYVEKDIERDSKAAEELAQKGRAQGVPTTGVPIFDIRGRLLPGFDPGAILKLLAATPSPQKTI